MHTLHYRVAQLRLLSTSCHSTFRLLSTCLSTCFLPAVVSCQTRSFGICDAGVPAGGITAAAAALWTAASLCTGGIFL